MSDEKRPPQPDNVVVVFRLSDSCLKAKKEAYDKEQERIKHEQEAMKQARITARIQALAQYGITYDTLEHGTMQDDVFEALISTKKQEFAEAEKARLAQIENDRIAKEKFEEDQRKFREEQAETDRKNKEAQDKIDSDRKTLEDEKQAIEKIRIDKENEEKRKLELTDIAEKARLKWIEDERLRKQREDAEKQQAEKAEQEKLQKKKKYQEFLTSIGFSETEKNDFTYIDTDEGRVFYKKVGIYKK